MPKREPSPNVTCVDCDRRCPKDLARQILGVLVRARMYGETLEDGCTRSVIEQVDGKHLCPVCMVNQARAYHTRGKADWLYVTVQWGTAKLDGRKQVSGAR